MPKGTEKAEKIATDGAKPHGPLVIAISIRNQNLKVYDSRGLFAESPISSGMAGHSTPMGVFSVIQKHKLHRSNIYSGAPMPYMQRITWSGVAIHAGVLPGYPASHGCIRMPMNFAIKMWNWTKMGARVVVTPGEVSPVDFSHPLLAALLPPQPLAAAPDEIRLSRIKTADAGSRLSDGGDSSIMIDLATSGTAIVPKVAVDPTRHAFGATASAAIAPSEADVAEQNAPATEAMPALPEPVPVDFSDITPIDSLPIPTLAAQAPARTIEGKTQTRVEAAEAGSAAIVAPLQPDAATAEHEPLPAAPLIKRTSPLAMFVSRKDQKLYVRQNFAPVLEMPIDIAPGSKTLGTHVFTAAAGGDGDKTVQWSVVSLPSVKRQASTRPEESINRRRRAAVEVAEISTSTAQEALARITLPTGLMARLGAVLPPGSSLVVSDQGIAQGETGEGTDFIVLLR